ncbi:MAG: AraC family transcriptional regulator [Lachnospiraceae bacterium]|nr:AraC family transcriptional regulator [Acetatifactor muris]MCM1219728.1 AraC family transcriptional regulator [Lachnospiraceae bacterium]
MDKKEILTRFLRSSLEVSVFCWEGAAPQPEEIEKTHCFSRTAQPFMTAAGIQTAAAYMKPDILYFIEDSLKIGTLLFRFLDCMIWAGPFVAQEWKEDAAKICLAKAGLSADDLIPYKFYYCSCGLWDQNVILRIVNGAISALLPDAPFYHVRMISKDAASLQCHPGETRMTDFNSVVQCYEWENQFISCIEKGQLPAALEIWNRMHKMFMRQDAEYPNYTDMIGNVAILRTIVRKAAERGGVHPAVIDAISISYAQKATAVRSAEALMSLNRDMIREYCRAVQDARSKKNSPMVRDAATYLNLHFSQDVSRDTLAVTLGCDPVALSRRFKAEMECTIGQYLAELRCKEAAVLLVQTDLPIQDISAQVGYLDNNYFVKVFKKYMGEVPTLYRKRFYAG